MNHVDIRKTLAVSLYDVLTHGDRLPKKPRSYQAETLTKIADWLSDPSGTRRSYVQHATGLGKTITFATAVRAARDLRSLIVVPSRPLLVQTARTVVKYTNGIIGHLSSVGNIANHDGEIIAVRGLDHSSVVIVTDASFHKFAQQILQDFDPHLILRDECHWGYSDEGIQTLNLFEEAVIVGFSATPDFLTNKARGGYTPVTLDNGQVLYGPRDKFADTHFQTCLDRRSLRWGIEEGWLAPLAWGLIDFEKISLKDVPIVNGEHGPDYDKSKLQAMLETHWSVMCETIRRLYENGEIGLHERQVYAVCPSVKAAEELSNTIASLGLSTACITGDTPSTERDILFEAYRDKEIRFMSSVRVLREGWDDPNAEVCMMLTPTVSYPYYVQPIGRCVRLPEDGSPKTSLVLDAHFQGKTFSPLSAPALFAPPGSEIPIGGILIERRGGCGGVRGASEEAPTLPKQANPRVIVVENYDQLLKETTPRAGQDGTFEQEGETWATIQVACVLIKVGRNIIRKRLNEPEGVHVRRCEGIDPVGCARTFYAIADLKKLCKKDVTISTALPNGDLFTVLELTRKLCLSAGTIQREIKAKGLKGVPRKGQKGRKKKCYSFREVHLACTNLLSRPILEEDETLVSEDVLWVSRGALRRGTCLNRGEVNGILESQEVQYMYARSPIGKMIKIYAFRDVQAYGLKRYQKNIERLEASTTSTAKKKPNQAGRDGTFVAEDGRRYVTIKRYADLQHVADSTVKKALEASGIRPTKGHTRIGIPRQFYAEEDINKALKRNKNQRR